MSCTVEYHLIRKCTYLKHALWEVETLVPNLIVFYNQNITKYNVSKKYCIYSDNVLYYSIIGTRTPTFVYDGNLFVGIVENFFFCY